MGAASWHASGEVWSAATHAAVGSKVSTETSWRLGVRVTHLEPDCSSGCLGDEGDNLLVGQGSDVRSVHRQDYVVFLESCSLGCSSWREGRGRGRGGDVDTRS